MGEKYLYQALPFLKDLDKNRREQFETYFQDAPLWLMDSFQIEEMDKGVIFVRENAPVDTIYFLGKVTIKATDYRMCGGIAYDFMRIDKVYAMGGMEIIMDLDVYSTTLQTVTPCTVVKMPKAQFERWIKTDIRVMKMEARLMGEYLLTEGRNSRAYLFLQGSDRLAMQFSDRYERYARQGVLCIRSTRQELSDATGLCVKTINRAIAKFTEQGLITREGNKILIDGTQYEGLKDIVRSVIEV